MSNLLNSITRRTLLKSSAATGLVAASGLATPFYARAATAPVFTHGVQSGDVDASTGMIWTRVDRPSRIMMEVSTVESFKDPIRLTAMNALPEGDFDDKMRSCLSHADGLKQEGRLIESQMLEDASTAKSVRIRKGRQTTIDGPFTETKEVLGGFNLIEAESMEEAVRIAAEFPWAQTGCVEVRPVRDIETVRQRVGGAAAQTVHS